MHVEIGISKLIGFIEGGRGEVNPIRHVQGSAREEYGRKPRHDAFVAMRAVVMIVVIVVMVVMACLTYHGYKNVRSGLTWTIT